MHDSKVVIFVFILLVSACSNENESTSDQLEQNIFDSSFQYDLTEPLKDRIFPFFTLIQRSPVENSFRTSLNDSLLTSFIKRLETNVESCQDVKCLLSGIEFSGQVRQFIQIWLEENAENDTFKDFVNTSLKPSGFFMRFQDFSNQDFLSSAWQESSIGVNSIIDVYGEGKAPRYPSIDSISYQTSDPVFIEQVNALLDSVTNNSYNLFFQPYLDISIGLLKINRRDEAARYHPLQEGHNKAAVEYIQKIDWANYDYSAIVVLGDGPENEGVPIESLGKFRVRLGYDRFNDGLAPLLIMTGGHVKPFQTPFAEAIEMKKVLMEDHKVPEKAILIDPHARHTTTNLRNISRLLIRYGVPLNKKVLVTTSDSQSKYVSSQKFQSRCMDELKYLPAKIQSRISKYDVAIIPNLESLHIAPSDPLDP